MTFISDRDYLTEIKEGNVSGKSIIHKFGASNSIGTTLTMVSGGEVYQTPTSAASLEFVGDATDALDDSGMHELTVIGLDANWVEQAVVTPAHATDGTIAVAIAGTWLRVYRAYISKSGTYATTTTPSHIAPITVRGAGAGSTWIEIPIADTNFGGGQSLCGAYTVPIETTGYVYGSHVWIDTGKTVDLVFFQRPNADDTSSSYSGALRIVNQMLGIQNEVSLTPRSPMGPFVGPCDIGFLAKGAQTPSVAIDFEILIVED